MKTMPMPDTQANLKPRVFFLDWLRVISMASVFLYHCNRFFDFYGWHIKNAELSTGSTIFENIMGAWIMPILFFLSGASIFYSLKSRSGGSFARERVLRLVVPLVVMGMLIFGPLQVYYDRLTHGVFSGSFWEFLPQYFNGFFGFGGNFAWMGIHLWYLLLLFLYSMLFLPLFLPSAKIGISPLSRLSGLMSKPWVLILLFIPLVLALNLTDILGLGLTRQMGGWDVFSYMLFLLYGYMAFANPKTVEIMKKYCYVFLAGAIAAGAFLVVMNYAVVSPAGRGFFLSSDLRTLVSWLTVLAISGLGARHLNFSNTFVVYANEAVLPFYILHQPVILSVGLFMIPLALPIPAKYCIILVCSFAVIMVLYELLVRRFNVLRFLFGMKAAKKKREVEGQTA
jgi:glucans biosynthesis protein C